MITSVQMETATRDRLRAKKMGGEDYDAVINRLLDQSEKDSKPVSDV